VARIIFALLLLLILPMHRVMAASKQAVDYESMYAKCLSDIGKTNNSSVMGCSDITSDAAKKEINSLYNTIHATILVSSKDDAAKFEASQKSWLNYRNTHCNLAGSYIGTPMYSFCPMQLNIVRIVELRDLANQLD
jgi:uncharacterized protein YecT (DUF1311 family)